jgi:general secretion pathway protein A
MRDTYLTHFGLREPPFTKEIPDGELWLPSSKQAVVDELVDAVEARASALLVGDPGVGKTCVLRAFRKRLPDSFRLTYCHNVTLGRRDFYRQLCMVLGLAPSATAAAVFHAVSSHVSELGNDRVHPVFLLDEAHLLNQDTLDHLHILLNYDWDSRSLLSLVLVGLPELLDRLSMRRNRSLFSRLHRRLRIDPLSPADTAEYLVMRLARVGCDRDIFASDAIAMIHEAATGGMRDVDRLATAAIREAARKKRRLVERDAVARVIEAHTHGDTAAAMAIT